MTELPNASYVPSTDREAECRRALQRYLGNQANLEKNLDELMSLGGGFEDRFRYLTPRMPAAARARLLVSGCAVGSEMIVARRHGFREVVGTEVTPALVECARTRLSGEPGFDVVLYDGKRLPFEDGAFTAVVSGHIIEHTPSPYGYLREHLRVLRPGGMMFLEFPSRYHRVELHTNLPSVEFLPMPLRWAALKYRASAFSRRPSDERGRYSEILKTLRPVSVWQIETYVRLIGRRRTRIAHTYEPAPGYVRMVLIKEA